MSWQQHPVPASWTNRDRSYLILPFWHKTSLVKLKRSKYLLNISFKSTADRCFYTERGNVFSIYKTGFLLVLNCRSDCGCYLLFDCCLSSQNLLSYTVKTKRNTSCFVHDIIVDVTLRSCVVNDSYYTKFYLNICH